MIKNRQKPPVSLYHSLLRHIISLIIFLSCSILIVIHFATSSVKMNISEILIDRVTNHVEAELQHFFEPVVHSLTSVRIMAEDGVINLSNKDDLTKIFFSIMKSTPQISSINIGDEYGNGFLLLKKQDKWVSRSINNTNSPGVLTWKRFNSKYDLEQEWTEPGDFDPRTQPWYICFTHKTTDHNIKAQKLVYWTDPYSFFTTHEPGITVSTVIQSPQGDFYVLALDILLTDITDMSSEISVTKNGDVFILSEDGALIGLPKNYASRPIEELKKLFLSSPLESDLKHVKDSYTAWLNKKQTQKDSFFFKCCNENWVGGVYPFKLNQDQKFLISIIFPENDFLYELKRQTTVVIIVALISMILAILLTHRITINYSEALKKIVHQSEKITNLDLSSTPPVASKLKEIQQLANVHENMRLALDSFSKYVPLKVVRELLEQGEAAKIGGKIDNLTILFTDIRGFTSITETINPRQLTNQLAEYFEVMLDILKSENATVDKFIGDAIVAFWGAPAPIKNHPFHAVNAVLKTHEAIKKLNHDWTIQGKNAFPTTFGLASGQVLVGNIGASSRLSYTVLGDIVNTANRIENINRFYGTEMLGSQNVKEATENVFLWRKIDTVQLVGKTSITNLFELVARKDNVNDAIIEKTSNYEKALELYQRKDFKGAILLLDKVLKKYPDDTPSIRLKNLCITFSSYPPSYLWDGVTKFSKK